MHRKIKERDFTKAYSDGRGYSWCDDVQVLVQLTFDLISLSHYLIKAYFRGQGRSFACTILISRLYWFLGLVPTLNGYLLWWAAPRGVPNGTQTCIISKKGECKVPVEKTLSLQVWTFSVTPRAVHAWTDE